MNKIVFAAGGTGGHVSPAVALAEAWKERDPSAELFMLGGDRVEEKDFDFPGERININPPQRPLHPKNWFKLARSLKLARDFLRHNKVTAVVATGGYACFPTLFAARSMRIPYWLFDANQRMGRVVKLFGSKAVDVIGPNGCTERKQSPKGNPVRARFESCRSWVWDGQEALKVLVTGGSGGAQTLDQRIPEVLNQLHEQVPMEVTHISRRDAGNVEYKMKAAVRPPGPDFLELLDNCHVLIGRAGGSTIAECNAAGRPQVLIPLPTAKDDHQRANAKKQVEFKAARSLDQSLSNDIWLEALTLFFTPENLKQAAEAAYNSYPRNLATSLVDEMREKLKA